MHTHFRIANLRIAGAALAACVGLAAWLVPASLATAATVTLTGGTTTCTYGSSTVDMNGNFNFSCTGGTTPQPGVLALNLSGTAASLPPGGTTTLVVTRTGMTTGGGVATGTLTASGGGGCTFPAGNTVTFPDGSGTASPASVTVTAGATPGNTCTITLTSTGGSATVGSPSSTNIGIVDPNAPVSFSFSTGTSTASFNGAALPVTITRTGGTAGAWEVPYYLGGSLVDASGNVVAGGGTVSPAVSGTPYAAGKVTFPAGSGASQSITFTPPATVPSGVTAPATIGYQLLDPVAVGTPPSGHTASLGLVTQHTTTVQVQTGCTTTANYTVPWNGSQTVVSQVKQNESAAVTVQLSPTSQVFNNQKTGKFVITETSTTGDQADVQFVVSACPGDFSKPAPCMLHTQYTGGTLTFSIGPKPPGTLWFEQVCELPAGTATVYFNFRQIKKPTPVPQNAPGTPSCQWTTCPVYVQYNGT